MMRNVAVALTVFLGVSSSAFAVTDCPGKITQVYVGDGGALIYSEGAPPAYIYQTSADFKSIYAAALLALNAEKQAAIRFWADGVPCTKTGSARKDVHGVWVGK